MNELKINERFQLVCPEGFRPLTEAEREKLIEQLTKEMRSAVKLLEFEHAAYLRDKIKELRG